MRNGTQIDLDALDQKLNSAAGQDLIAESPIGELLSALIAELRAARERYGKDGEVWCGARRDQAGTAYCVEMAGHDQDDVPHLWKTVTS
jgi:hypothetical protein